MHACMWPQGRPARLPAGSSTRARACRGGWHLHARTQVAPRQACPPACLPARVQQHACMHAGGWRQHACGQTATRQACLPARGQRACMHAGGPAAACMRAGGPKAGLPPAGGQQHAYMHAGGWHRTIAVASGPPRDAWLPPRRRWPRDSACTCRAPVVPTRSQAPARRCGRTRGKHWRRRGPPGAGPRPHSLECTAGCSRPAPTRRTSPPVGRTPAVLTPAVETAWPRRGCPPGPQPRSASAAGGGSACRPARDRARCSTLSHHAACRPRP